MEHWTSASNPVSRNYLDGLPDMNFKDEVLLQNYWMGQPAAEADYGFDLCRYMHVGSTNYEGFQADMNYSPDNQPHDYPEMNDHAVHLSSSSAPSGNFPFLGQISGKRRVESMEADGHEGGPDAVPPFDQPWGHGTMGDGKNKENYLRLSWDCLKKEPQEQFKVATLWQKNGMNNDQTSSEFGFPKENSAAGLGIPGNVCSFTGHGHHRNLAARKIGEKRQTKPEKVISLDVLRQHFARSLKDAAKLMGVCPTTLKRICRQHGITRWPSRKIKKVNHSLKKLQLVVDSVEGAEGLIKIGSLYSNYPDFSASDLQKNRAFADVNSQPPPPQLGFDDHFLETDISKSDCSSSSQNSGFSGNPFRVKTQSMKHVSGSSHEPSPELGRYEHSTRLKLGKESVHGGNRQRLRKEGDLIKVKATMGEAHIRFTLLPQWNFKDLQQEIARRFSVDEIAGICLKYIDSDHETVLLTCDDDLQECKELFRSNNCHIIKMTVHLP